MAKKSDGKKLRYAFIGAGGIAGAHMSYLAKMPDVELVALADVNEASMARHAETYKIPKANCFTDYKQMLAKIGPEAVSVCTPNGLHAPNTIAALNAGAAVLVEKPLAMNAKEGQAMLDAAKKNNQKLVIGFQYRFGPNSTFLRKAVAAGKFGEIMYTKCQALRRRGIPNWGVFGRKDLQGGGPMIDIGVHILEVAHFVMGSPKPVSASGNTWTYMGDKKSDVASMWPNWDHKTYTVEDLAVGQIRFENGAILSIESSFVAHIEKDIFNFSLMGQKSGANWDPAQIYTDDNGYMLNSTPGFLPSGPAADHFAAKMRNFVDHVLHGKPTLAPAEHGLMVQKMLDGIYASAKSGGEVSIA
ncbi:MAG: Gfo/Idh/MocA family oxidoreductase [Planctomycetota bacterium]|nr:Gfo/Idh/MocA family oxidoreductase [Planctomycetota bacterium]